MKPRVNNGSLSLGWFGLGLVACCYALLLGAPTEAIAAKGSHGYVRVTSMSADATVVIDGRTQGVVAKGSSKKFKVRAGKRRIEVRAAGFDTHTERVVVSAGSTKSLKIALTAVAAFDDGLALVPLAPLGGDKAPLPKKKAKAQDLALEPLKTLPDLTAAPPTTKPNRLDLTPAPVPANDPSAGPSPWYKKWWTWAGAGAVLVGGAVATAVLLSGDREPVGPQFDGTFSLCQDNCGGWRSALGQP